MFRLSERAVDEIASSDPVEATYAGVSGFDDQWTDYSPEGYSGRRELAARLGREAAATRAEDRTDVLARRVLADYCEEKVDFVDSGDCTRELRNIASPFQEIRTVYDLMPQDSPEDWEVIARRLETTAQPLRGYRASLEAGRRAGNTVARRQVEDALTQARNAAGPGSSLAKLKAPEVHGAGLQGRVEVGTASARAAFAELADYLAEDYLPDAGAADGVGQAEYLRAARRQLGSDIDLAETYSWGWEELRRLGTEFEAVCAEIDDEATPGAVLERLKTDPGMAATSLSEFVELMQDRQQQALESLDGTHFRVPDEIRSVEVKVEAAGGALAPHYTSPSEDLSRPGTVWYPVEGREFFPLFQEVTTAYHEGLPGHHLQIGTQAVERERLSRFHRVFVWYPGAGEGWALYAEHLMAELGYLERPEYRAGYIASQLFRSCRIVIDIGMHLGLPIPLDSSFHPGETWNADLGYEMLTEVALQPDEFARSELVRYLGWPGQAISYKVGERAIHELRAEAARSSEFSSRRFHTELLACGAVGLDLLREMMRG